MCRRAPDFYYALSSLSAVAGLVAAGGAVLSGATVAIGPGGCSQPRKLGPFTVEMCWI